MKIRDYNPATDEAFIRNTWFRQAWKQRLPNSNFDTFAPVQRDAISCCLAEAKTVVAYLEDAPTEILGWGNAHPATLNFIYVKAPYRRNYIATQILAHLGGDAIKQFSSRGGKEWVAFRKRLVMGAVFDPLWLTACATRAHSLRPPDNGVGENGTNSHTRR